MDAIAAYVITYLRLATQLAFPGIARQFATLGFAPESAAAWAAQGYLPSEANNLVTAGCTGPDNAEEFEKELAHVARCARCRTAWTDPLGQLSKPTGPPDFEGQPTKIRSLHDLPIFEAFWKADATALNA